MKALGDSDRDKRDWEHFGEREPYFAVLTDEHYLMDRMARGDVDEFFATGERDVEMLSRFFVETTGRHLEPEATLDFGCGVGRLTIPLARISKTVTAVDVAESMLARTEQAIAREGLSNVRCLLSSELGTLEPRAFDFVCSLIVFQHIPIAAGERHLARLLDLTAPDGAVALHFTFRRPGGVVRRLLRKIRRMFPAVHRVVSFLRGDRKGLPYLQMNTYDERRVRAIFAGHGFSEPFSLSTDHGGVNGKILFATRSGRPPRPFV